MTVIEHQQRGGMSPETTTDVADDSPLTALLADVRGRGVDDPLRRRLGLPWPAGWPRAGVSEAVAVSGVAILAARYTGQEEVTIALTTGPVRLGIAPQMPFDAVRRQVESLLAARGGAAATDFLLPKCACTEMAVRLADDSQPLGDAPYALCFDLRRGDVGPGLQIEFDARQFAEATIRRLGAHLGRLLAAAMADPQLPISTLPLMDAAEAAALWAMCCGETRSYPLDRTIAEHFEAQVARTPDAIAIEMRGEMLRYADLDADANRLAALLLRETPADCRVVPVLHDRRPAFLVAVLAVLKCAKAFLPIDPFYPPERIEFMLRKVRAGMVITESTHLDALGPVLLRAGVRRIATTDGAARAAWAGERVFDRGVWGAMAEAEVWPPRSPRDPAYVIFTSGSTGQPKGVVNRHDGALNHLFFEVEALNLTPATRFLQTAQLTTDLCVWQFLAPVLIGATCVVAPQEDVVDPRRLLGVLQRCRITMVELVPLLMNLLAEHVCALDADAARLPDLRWMMVSGEPLTAELANRWLAMYPDIPVVNAYGPTEVSDDSTQHIVYRPLPPGCVGVPIGRPLPNLRVMILDAAGALVPVGVPGELHVSGIGLADGYWEDPERTRAAFVPDPHAEQPGALMYRTGDRGRWLPDGNIELFGRLDDQVKIRGCRVELREIEAVLRRHPAVANAVVVVREDLPGHQRLVAYVVPVEPAVTPAALRGYLATKLPDPMVPVAYVLLSQLPMTENGVKVNRRALPPPPQSTAQAEPAEPGSPLERELATIWSTILGRHDVGVHDNFFELGGDSMMTIEVSLMARRRGIELPVTALFQQPTIAGLAEIVRRAASDVACAADAECDDGGALASGAASHLLEGRHGEAVEAYPLTPTQRGIYLARLLEDAGSGIYVEQVAGTLHDPAFDGVAFERAWRAVAQHHAVLRTVFVRRGLDQPLQLVRPHAEVSLRCLGALSSPDAFEALAAEEATRRMKLDELPLMRVVVVRLDERRHRLLWTYPHLLLDGWSESIVLDQVLQTYDAFKRGMQPCLPETTPFRDFVARSSRPASGETRDFWAALLRDAPPPTPLPWGDGDARRPAGSRRFGRADADLPPDFAERVELAARAHRWTVNTLLQGAWALLLAWRSGRDDVRFGVSVSGRQIALPGVEDMVGMLANTVPLRIRVCNEQRADAWLDAMQGQQFASRRHEHVALEQIQQCGGPRHGTGPLFSTYFVFANYPSRSRTGMSSTEAYIADLDLRTQPHYPLTLYLRPTPDQRFVVRAIHDERLLGADDASALLRLYVSIVSALVAEPGRTLEDLRDAVSALAPAPTCS